MLCYVSVLLPFLFLEDALPKKNRKVANFHSEYFFFWPDSAQILTPPRDFLEPEDRGEGVPPHVQVFRDIG